MLEDEVAGRAGAARDVEEVDGLRFAAEVDGDIADLPGARQPVEHAVGRCQYGGLPAGGADRGGQIAQDVADTADLAAWQGAVLRSQEYDVSSGDGGELLISA